jgi:hypothetical protein
MAATSGAIRSMLSKISSTCAAVNRGTEYARFDGVVVGSYQAAAVIKGRMKDYVAVLRRYVEDESATGKVSTVQAGVPQD